MLFRSNDTATTEIYTLSLHDALPILLYRRWGRVTPLIIAHSLIDATAFIGYAALHGKVSWLP